MLRSDLLVGDVRGLIQEPIAKVRPLGRGCKGPNSGPTPLGLGGGGVLIRPPQLTPSFIHRGTPIIESEYLAEFHPQLRGSIEPVVSSAQC